MLDSRGALIAQNTASPWPSKDALVDYVSHSSQARPLVAQLFSTDHREKFGLWIYHDQLYQVVGLPLLFNAGDNKQTRPDGALIMAAPVTDAMANNLADTHNCEFTFFSTTKALASSLPPPQCAELVAAMNTRRWPASAPFDTTLDHVNYRSYLEPLIDPGSGTQLGATLIQTSRADGEALQARISHSLIIIMSVGLLMTAILSFMLSGAVTRPVQELLRGVRRVGAGDLDYSMSIKRRDELGELAGAFNDMVSQLRTRRELQRLVEESQSASKAKSQFLANMSHEIRTPLHGVIGMANLLLGTNLNDRQRRYATLVKSSTEVLTTLINDILDFSKIEAGKLELESCEFNPHTVVEDVVELLSQKSFARGVEMICHISTNVPTAAKGDSTRLRQILMNLIGNAVKFTETGEIVVRANCESSADGKILVRFAISDSGIGIPQDRVDRLFKSFSQVDASTTRRFGGTGLGLAISKQLAELMGGQIGVKSERGRGSTFWFTIALEAVNAAPAENFTEFSGIRALVVDDNATSGKIICQELIDAGANAVATADTKQAIELLTAAGNAGEPFGLVILDREQPGVDVCELATQINLQFKSAPPTLLLLTTAPGEMSPQELTTAGFHGAVTKPVRRSQLITAVARIILGKSDDAPSSESFEPVAVDKSFRILLAEDNEVNQVVACEFLRNRGYTIEIACDGSAAVEAIQRENFDLVLMDCQMPVMDGFEATAAIRKLEETAAADGKSRRRVPIIALTANASNADRGRCLAAGMDAYCGKPFQPRELLDVIASFLSEDAPAIAAPESPLKSADPSTDKPVFDIGTFLERCTGNYSLVMTILEKFERQAADAIAQLETCVKDGDAKQMAKLAHGLKGTAGIVAAESLRSAVAKLEELARGDTLDDAKNCLQQVQEEMRRCSSHIPLARSQLQQSAPIG